jgi:prophage regulatory protein
MVRLLAFEELASKGIRLSKSTVRRLENAGKFPRHVHPSPGTNAWVESEIDEYIVNLAAARDSDAGDGA